MKTRNIQRTFNTISDLGFKNLLVSGCSFTYNNSDDHACTWPYYLRDLGNFESVLDCSFPGAGNKHIHDSTIYAIEEHNINPKDTLIVILWTGNDRDDFIIDKLNLNSYAFQYGYSTSVATGISGGIHYTNQGNINSHLIAETKKVKTLESRSIENYLYIAGLYHYLSNQHFNFLFLEYRDFELPATDCNFDIRKFLPSNLVTKFNQMITPATENFYRYCLYNNLLSIDDYHPSPDGHLKWTQNILFPMLSKMLLTSNK